MAAEHTAPRLVALAGVTLAPADLEAVTAEFEDYERALAELETFSAGVVWPSAQVQPDESEAEHDPH